MGAPALAYFCHNGHLVLNVPHHYITDSPTICPYCESKEIKSVLEWQDPDYGPRPVSSTPIKYETREVQIPIYNVNKLFRKKK